MYEKLHNIHILIDIATPAIYFISPCVILQSNGVSVLAFFSLRTESRKAHNSIPSPLTIFNQQSTSLQCHGVICTYGNYCNHLQPIVHIGTVRCNITKLRVFYLCFIHTFRVVPKIYPIISLKKTNESVFVMYMVMTRDQNVRRIHSMRTHNSTFERVGEFKYTYLGTTLTNLHSIAEEIKSRLRSGNACYYSVQKLLSSRLLSKNLKIKIYRTITLPVILYGCETWSLTLLEERKAEGV